LNCGFCIPYSRFQILDSGFWIPNSGFQIPIIDPELSALAMRPITHVLIYKSAAFNTSFLTGSVIMKDRGHQVHF